MIRGEVKTQTFLPPPRLILHLCLNKCCFKKKKNKYCFKENKQDWLCSNNNPSSRISYNQFIKELRKNGVMWIVILDRLKPWLNSSLIVIFHNERWDTAFMISTCDIDIRGRLRNACDTLRMALSVHPTLGKDSWQLYI